MLPGLEESRYMTFHHGLLLLKRCHTLLVLCKAGQCRGIAAFFFFFFFFCTSSRRSSSQSRSSSVSMSVEEIGFKRKRNAIQMLRITQITL